MLKCYEICVEWAKEINCNNCICNIIGLFAVWFAEDCGKECNSFRNIKIGWVLWGYNISELGGTAIVVRIIGNIKMLPSKM